MMFLQWYDLVIPKRSLGENLESLKSKIISIDKYIHPDQRTNWRERERRIFIFYHIILKGVSKTILLITSINNSSNRTDKTILDKYSWTNQYNLKINLLINVLVEVLFFLVLEGRSNIWKRVSLPFKLTRTSCIETILNIFKCFSCDHLLCILLYSIS